MEKYATALAALVSLAAASCARASAHEAEIEAKSVDAGVVATTAGTSSAAPPAPPPAAAPGDGLLPVAIVAAALTPQAREACPEGMALVEGEYCPNVEQKCLEWMDPPGTPYEHFRCKRYAQPAVCHGKREHRRFCIDVVERTEAGSALPRNHMSWSASKSLCEAEGGRLCKTSEWQFACEGEEMRPYPYGWERDATACNVDVMSGLGKVGKLVDHRAPASAHPRCASPFGVHDMAGNVDEWATVDGQRRGEREVMKGSWWLPGRHACRAHQGGHGAFYGGTESGTRCCADATSATTKRVASAE